MRLSQVNIADFYRMILAKYEENKNIDLLVVLDAFVQAPLPLFVCKIADNVFASKMYCCYTAPYFIFKHATDDNVAETTYPLEELDECREVILED